MHPVRLDDLTDDELDWVVHGCVHRRANERLGNPTFVDFPAYTRDWLHGGGLLGGMLMSLRPLSDGTWSARTMLSTGNGTTALRAIARAVAGHHHRGAVSVPDSVRMRLPLAGNTGAELLFTKASDVECFSVDVSHLDGLALDWSVEWAHHHAAEASKGLILEALPRCFTKEWGNAGEVIERERIEVGFLRDLSMTWRASMPGIQHVNTLPMTAAMRCFVQRELGTVVRVPAELKRADGHRIRTFGRTA